jgi:hypothetical protein
MIIVWVSLCIHLWRRCKNKIEMNFIYWLEFSNFHTESTVCFDFVNVGLSFTGITKSIFIITDSMEQSPWQGDRCSVKQQISHLFQNSKIHYHVCQIPQQYFILRQLNWDQILVPNFFRICFNSFFPCMAATAKWQVFWLKFCMYISTLSCKLHVPPNPFSFIY